MSIKKNQHTVPRSYLGFFIKNGPIYTFDKIDLKVFPNNIGDVTTERFFYDFPLDIIKNAKSREDAQILENALSNIDGEYKKYINKIKSKIMMPLSSDKINIIEVFTEEEQELFAELMAIQIIRSKDFREIMIQANQKFKEYDKKIKKTPSDKKSKFYLNEDYLSVVQYEYLTDPKVIKDFVKILTSPLWVFWVNKTSKLFYTSDNPIVKNSNLKKHGILGSPATEVFYPLTSRIALVLIDRRYAQTRQPDMFDYHNKFFFIRDEKEVDRHNYLQVIQSYRQVYCAEDDFELAKKICMENPEIRNPKRDRNVLFGTKYNK
jgi:hypothetical protein